jgi:TonB family protein
LIPDESCYKTLLKEFEATQISKEVIKDNLLIIRFEKNDIITEFRSSTKVDGPKFLILIYSNSWLNILDENVVHEMILEKIFYNQPEGKHRIEMPKVNQGVIYKQKGESGDGTGAGGKGVGGDGVGFGSGTGRDLGTGFDLKGRSWSKKPGMEDNSEETGRVVIEIVVDKNGNVTSANGPARGSTTASPSLYKKAKQAALQAKFSPSPDGVEEQRGTITFDFRIR